MSSILVDSSILIDFLRRKDKTNAVLIALAAQNDLYVSVLIHTELWSGKSVWESKKVQKELELLFSGIVILPVTESVSKLAGKLKSENRAIALIDCVIAATALHHDMQLATLNHKHFSVFKKLQLTPAQPQTAQTD